MFFIILTRLRKELLKLRRKVCIILLILLYEHYDGEYMHQNDHI